MTTRMKMAPKPEKGRRKTAARIAVYVEGTTDPRQQFQQAREAIRAAGLQPSSPAEAISAIRAGFPASSLEQLRVKLDVSTPALAALTSIAVRTLARRVREGRLRMDESDRVYRMNALFERTVEVLGNDDAARRWMKSPNRALGGKTPLEYAETAPGVKEIENLLGRIEHGVFS